MCLLSNLDGLDQKLLVPLQQRADTRNLLEQKAPLILMWSFVFMIKNRHLNKCDFVVMTEEQF